LRVGIAFDLVPSGPSHPESDGPDDRFEEFDKPATVEAISAVLRGRGHEVILLGDGPEFVRRVLDDPPDLVWNMAEGQGAGRCREARVPAVLEMLGIPHTGSDPLTLAATLDKHVAKQLVASAGVSVAPGRALPPDLGASQFRSEVGPLFRGPDGRVLLKPAFEGSSKGIRASCLVRSVDDGWSTFRRLADDYRQTILAEEFIVGDEVTVGLLGGGEGCPITEIGIMRVIPRDADPWFVYSLEVKRDWEARVAYESPARMDAATLDRLGMASKLSYDALGCRDLARIDFRVRSGIPYFIEANPLPGLAPGTSDLVILAEGCGLPYPDLIGRILDTALGRLGLAENRVGTFGR